MFAYWDLGAQGPLGSDYRDPCLLQPIGPYPRDHISDIQGTVGDVIATGCCGSGRAQLVDRWNGGVYAWTGAFAFECCVEESSPASAGRTGGEDPRSAVCRASRRGEDACGRAPRESGPLSLIHI